MRFRHLIVVAAATAMAPSLAGIAHADPPAKESAHEGVSARDVVAYTALGLGAAALAFGVAETVHWYSVYEDGRSLQGQLPASVHNACDDQGSATAAKLCQDSKDTSSAWTLAMVGYGSSAVLATTGFVLLLTRPHDTTSNSGHLDVTPAVSQRSAGVQLRLSF
jgi:hypothetical protein